MNRMLFNDGGQPVYLDDLKLLQGNPEEQESMLLNVLSGGASVFLLNKANAEIVGSDTVNFTTTFKISKNWVAWNGMIYEIPETTVTVPSWDTPVYVGLRSTKTETRTFEDGQEHACVETKEAYLSLENTEPEMVNLFDLKSLFELMGPLVNANEPVSVYKDIPVQLYNGYTGKVQYKEELDHYKVIVKLTSHNTGWDLSSGALFGINPSTYGFMAQKVSNSFLTGGDAPAREQIAQIKIVDGGALLSGIDLTSDTNTPLNCPINTIMIIPK
ncbi:hypothetical protein [[Hallella] seregens]|uniref:Uncharacterized protein n=1 Tax=Hallella seregens ATCC 51272 TaxID=1336250 RepID=A0ABV5ZKD3_9BACT|nr:hypothetical protein [Hallella seregens]